MAALSPTFRRHAAITACVLTAAGPRSLSARPPPVSAEPKPTKAELKAELAKLGKKWTS